jgi:hypothetical protein
MKRFIQSLSLGIMTLGMIFHSNQGFAQIFGEYQSANLVGKGKTEVTAQFNGVRLGYDGESDFVFNVLAFQAGFGLGDKFELRLRYDRLWYNESGIGDGFNAVTIAPKFGTNSGKFAFLLPISTLFDSGGEGNWLLSPTVLFTLPLGENVKFTFAPKYIISLEEYSEISDSLLSLNVGFGIDVLDSWIARPEIGISFIPSEEGNFFNYGIGVSRILGKSK